MFLFFDSVGLQPDTVINPDENYTPILDAALYTFKGQHIHCDSQYQWCLTLLAGRGEFQPLRSPTGACMPKVVLLVQAEGCYMSLCKEV